MGGAVDLPVHEGRRAPQQQNAAQHRGHGLALVEVHHPHTGGRTTLHRHVVDGDADRTVTVLGARSSQHGVGDRSRDVPGFGVAERPRPGRSGRLAGGPGAAGLPLTAPSGKAIDVVKLGSGSRPRPLADGSVLDFENAVEYVERAVVMGHRDNSGTYRHQQWCG